MELFKSPDHAAMFALRYSSQQYPESPMSKMMRRKGAVAVGQGKGLQQLDGAAQAGMILARLDRLPPMQRACVIARYADRTDECPCCSGQRLTVSYKAALMDLAEWSRPLIRAEVDSQRLRFGIVRSYFDRKQSLTQLANSIGMAPRTVLDQKNKVWPELAKLAKGADSAIGNMLADLCDDQEE